MVSYKKLAPSWSILSQYKKDKDAAKYAARFKKEILGQLDPKQVLNELLRTMGLDSHIITWLKL